MWVTIIIVYLSTGGLPVVGGNQHGVLGVVPEAKALSVMLRAAALDLLLLLK